MPFSRPLLLLALSLLASGAHAEPWFCALNLTVEGNIQHMRVHGKDSWTGATTLVCVRGGQIQERYVNVTLNSWNVAFGADKNSRVGVQVKFNTESSPRDLQIIRRWFELKAVNEAAWTFAIETEKTEGEVTLTGADDNALKSLSRGTLYIRAAIRDWPSSGRPQ